MKHLTLTSIALVTPLSVAPQAHAYTYNGLTWQAPQLPLPINLHNANADDLITLELETIVEASLATWNDVSCASIELQYAGLTEETIAVDDRQVLQWISDPDAWVYGSMAAGATIIATSDDPATPELDRPHVDIAFNNVHFRWVVGGAGVTRLDIVDPQSVVTHELGHLMGISHTQPDLDNVATMAATYVPDLSQRTLAPDDKQALCELYWQEASECDTDADCPTGETCQPYVSQDNGATVQLCYETRGTFGDFCNADDLNCQGLCLFQSSDLQEGFCSTLCQSDEVCPDGWTCRNIMSTNNPLFVCRELEEDSNATPDADDTSDAGSGGTSGGNKNNKGCATTPGAPATPWTGLMTLALMLLPLKRRRKTHPPRGDHASNAALLLTMALMAIMASVAAPDLVMAQSDMTFEATEPSLRTHVFVLEASRISRRDIQSVKTVIEDRVAQNTGYEVLRDRDMQREVRRSWNPLRRCKDRECVFDNVIDASLDRVIFVRLSRDGGLIVDMEINDAYERALIKFTVAPAESARDAYVIEAAVDELLTPDLPPTPPQQASAAPAPANIPDRPLGPPPSTGPVIDNEIDNEIDNFNTSAPPADSTLAIPPMALYTLYGGGGLLALGGVFALLADNTQAEIQAQKHDRATLEELIQSGQRFKTGANTMFGLGAAAVATSAVLFFVLDPPADASASQSNDDPLKPSAPDRRNTGRLDFGLSPNGATLRLRY